MNCAAVNITVPTITSTISISPTRYQRPSATIAMSGGEASITPIKPANMYKAAKLCTCKDPSKILTCDCAYSDITTTNDQRIERDAHPVPPVPFSARPTMLVADDSNGCLTPRTDAELKYPEPGPEEVVGDGEYPLRLPEGRCKGVGR